MARSRSLPTNLFQDPDFFEQGDGTQIILVGLVLYADDYGRGQAHPGLLARELNRTVPQIEEALSALEERELLLCYQVGRHRYYALTRWSEWETLSKPTPSKYPAPPVERVSRDQQGAPVNAGISQERADKHNLSPVEEEQASTQDAKSNDGAQESVPANVVAFPTMHADTDNAAASFQKQVQERTRQVATILKLTVDDALTRIVEEYLPDPELSLLGEADAAREWIENPRRNQKGQQITPAFFRRWLKREQEARPPRQIAVSQSTNQATGEHQPPTGTPHALVKTPASDPYAEYIRRRERECHEEWLATQMKSQVEGDQRYA